MISSRAVRPIRLLVALLGAFALFATACGDDDGGGSGSAAMSDAEFCELMAEMEELDLDIDDAEAFALLGQIARQAPDAELRAAMMTVVEAFEELEGLDEDDPEAMMAVFALMGNAEFMAAGETIDRYMSEVCGLDTGGDFDDIPFDDDDGYVDDDSFGDDTDEGGFSFGGDTQAMDDLSAGDVREALAPAFEEFAPDNRGTGVGITPNFGGPGTVVDATAYDDPNVDGVGLCEALAEVVASLTDDPDVRLEIFSDDTLIAERDIGGSCVAV